MASTLKNLSGLFSDMKTRTIILVTAGILFIAVIVGVIGFSKNSNQSQGGSSVVGPGNITSIPGTANVSPQVAQVQSSLNTQRYNAALQQGKSSMPSVIGVGGAGGTKSDIFFSSNKKPPPPKVSDPADLNGSVLQTASSTAAQQEAAQQQSVSLPDNNAQGMLTQDQDQDQTRQQAQQKLTDSMTSQAKAALAAWGSGQSGTPTQTYIESNTGNKNNGTGSSSTSSSSSTTTTSTSSAKAPKGPAIIKAGDVMFAILNTSIDSDEPGPVMAVIVGGDYKGSKLVGALESPQPVTGTNGPFGVTLKFRIMNVPEESNSINITAVAIDPDTARTALANDVDHHYLYRYGSLFASSFLEGYGSAIQSSGSVSINNTDGSSTQFNQQLSPKQTFLAALGEVGQQWGEQLGDSFNRPNTITVNAGISIGILFLADVTLDSPAEPPETIKIPSTIPNKK